ncbi:MAG: NUDIX domain-containing protein [Thermaurantimonas sp.]|uniref:NUDIX domain-containing protein n=1 Tax=Thermaurantimonas sp. TaxID=2681568 RepID=UPI003919C222
MSSDNPWTTLNDKIVYENKWIRVHHRDIINPNGGKGIYGLVHFKNFAIGIVPIDDGGYTYIVGQYRYPLNRNSWEIPEGGGPEDEDVLESAKRELKEEIGAVANKWFLIQELDLSNSATDEISYIFLAGDLTFFSTDNDETELLEIKKIKVEEFISLVLNGEIRDSISVAAGLKLFQLIASKSSIIIENFPQLLSINFNRL